MGQRDFETKLYYQLSIDELVPQDHLLRRIAEAVDFSFVRPLCRPYYSHTGQPSVDPVVIFKMLLLGYLYGITSERRLAEEVRLHLGYRWFLGYDFDAPTRPTIASSPRRVRASATTCSKSSSASQSSSAGRRASWRRGRSTWTALSCGPMLRWTP